MFYIDDYNSKAIIDTLPFPVKKAVNEATGTVTADPKKPAANQNAFKYFWFVIGATVGQHYEVVDKVLSDKYHIVTTDPNDAVSAITDMYGTDRFVPFLKDIFPLMEDVSEDFPQNPNTEESGFVVALIAGAAAVIGGAFGLAGKNKELKAQKEAAKANAITGLSTIIAEKEKTKAELIKQQGSERKLLIIGIISLILITGIIAAIIIYKRNKVSNA